jgi:putative transposase
MADYRRWYIQGGTAFFTVVTHRRAPIFKDIAACRMLGNATRVVCRERPFQTVATVLLPDHLHAIWSLPPGDDDYDYSTRWKRIKREFTVAWTAIHGDAGRVTPSQSRRGHRGVWQRRFYEHQITDEEELEALCDYIHYNPVKHGHAAAPRDWPHSTFHRFVKAGQYALDWGSTVQTTHPCIARLALE